MFQRNSSTGSARGWFASNPGPNQPKKRLPIDPFVDDRHTGGTEHRGVIAGRVVNEETGEPVPAYIRYASLSEADSGDAPIDVSVNSKGYFTIYGLKPGKRYRLLAYADVGGRKLANTVFATAPDVRMVIQVSERFVTPDTPTPPESPTLSRSIDTPPVNRDRHENRQASRDNRFGVGTPQPLDEDPLTNPPPPKKNLNDQWADTAPTPPRTKEYLPNIASGDAPKREGVRIRTRPFAGDPQPVENPDDGLPDDGLPPSPPGNGSTSQKPRLDASNNGGTIVPSSVVVGGRIINIALPDFTGKTWEWKRDRKGKLVLLDFWSTTCPYCIMDMPQLNDLQKRFGPRGLELLGVATERNGTFKEQRTKVIRVCHKKQTRYRMLMNSGAHRTRLLRQFDVTAHPTLILFDDRGNELWRHTGRLNANDLAALERFLQSRLR